MLSPTELIALRRPTNRPGPFVLVAKDQPAFFQIVGRHFDRHSIPGQGFDPVLPHSSGGIGNERMAVVELNAVTRVGQYLGDETLELQKFFLGHVMILLNEPPAGRRAEQNRVATRRGAA
jgi:hypothetical protein